ncbi:cytochrome bd ubiquinol oxidase%2Csubunit I [Bordetella ansorpii]|uniref:Cytochrome bd ubiquinol oxidase,subunit I n=1 Tax=Bordetella ansorpii TaxID=288768 RepID=A0A157S5Q1_9BORD|nr:cytochrome ubiquinol oxidase subunit I [Bordetella ansorpii]SAI65732.1 cytochrome bd ubiquinol oxidase%2Csubunit I [Bordetella ansorpii]
MEIPSLLLARAQFLVSFSFLALFMAVALALAWLLLFFKIRARVTGQAGWTAAYRFWVRIFALSFVLALGAALPVLVQMGSLWGGVMDRIGNVAGPLVGYGVLSVFVLKSCFLGVMLFGQRRVSDAAHTLAVFMVAIGQLVAVGWLVALHSWMQTPDGAALIEGRYQVYDWPAVVFNPSFGWSMALTVLGALLAAAFLIMGVIALQTLRRPPGDGERNAFKAAAVVAAFAALLQAPAALGLAELVAVHQPAKAAAVAGYWHTGAQPELALVGWPDAETQTNLYSWTVHSGSRLLGRTAQGEFVGLDRFAGMQPPVALVFWSARVAVLLGLAMLGAACLTLLLGWRRHLDPSALPAWWLRTLIGMTFAGGIAAVAGWWVSLVGLLPYTVNRTVTQSEVLSSASHTSLGYGLLAYVLLYLALGLAFVGMLLHAARYGVVPVRKAIGGAA